MVKLLQVVFGYRSIAAKHSGSIFYSNFQEYENSNHSKNV